MSIMERTDLPTIRLDFHVGTAVIIPHPTGVIYVNQAGGTACMQPGIEGALVPFGNDVACEGNVLLSPQLALEAYFEGPRHRGSGARHGMDDEDAETIDGILMDARVGSWLKVDRARLKDSMEAWVHVTVLREDDINLALPGVLTAFGPYPRPGVLVWMNSD